MSKARAEEPVTRRSMAARLGARVAGGLWLVVIVTGIFAEIGVRSRLLVRDDAAATAINILQHQMLFRLGVVSDLTATACYLAVVAILHELLKPAGRGLSRVAAAFGVAGSAISALNILAFFAPLVILTNAAHLPGFTAQQLDGLALLDIKLYGFGAEISLVFFSGVYLILIGVLFVRSKFLPSALGALLAAAGACYLVASGSSFVAPVLTRGLGALTYLPGGIAETAVTIWLTVVGVDPRRWELRAAEPTPPTDGRI